MEGQSPARCRDCAAPLSIFKKVVSSTMKQQNQQEKITNYKWLRGVQGGGEIKLFWPAEFPARQMTMTGIEIKREGTQWPFHLTSRASSFGLQQHLPAPHLGFSPGIQETFQASQKNPQNGFRNRINLLQGEKSGFLIYLREKGEIQEARGEIWHDDEHHQQSKLITLNTKE